MVGYEELGPVGILTRLACSGFSANGLQDRRIAELAGLGTDELVATLRRNLRPRGVGRCSASGSASPTG